MLAPGIQQFFLPAAAANPHYTPVALGIARVTFADAKLKINETREVVAVAPIGAGAVPVDWSQAEILDIASSDLETAPAEGATFDPVPKAATVGEELRRVAEGVCRLGVARSQTLDLYRHAGLKLTSQAGESERDFRIRVQDAQREARDAEVEDAAAEFRREAGPAGRALRRAEQGVSREQEQASAAKVQTAVSMGATVLGALFGRKTFSASTLGRATTAARGVGRASKEQDDVKRAQENVDVAKKALEELDAAHRGRNRRHRRALRRRPPARSKPCRSPRSAVRCSCSPWRWAGELKLILG